MHVLLSLEIMRAAAVRSKYIAIPTIPTGNIRHATQ